VQVHPLTSSQSLHETLDLFLTRKAAEAELREIPRGRARLERRAARRADRARRAGSLGELLVVGRMIDAGRRRFTFRFACIGDVGS
jgi:hypothetical protein